MNELFDLSSKQWGFMRRSTAFFTDLIFLVLISIPFMFVLTLTLSLISPNKYENPVHQIQEALMHHKSIRMKFNILIEPLEKEKDEDTIILGEGLTWVHEIFVFYLYLSFVFIGMEKLSAKSSLV